MVHVLLVLPSRAPPGCLLLVGARWPRLCAPEQQGVAVVERLHGAAQRRRSTSRGPARGSARSQPVKGAQAGESSRPSSSSRIANCRASGLQLEERASPQPHVTSCSITLAGKGKDTWAQIPSSSASRWDSQRSVPRLPTTTMSGCMGSTAPSP